MQTIFPPEPVLAELHGCIGKISDCELVVGGQESQTFRFRTEGQNCIVRLNRVVEGFEKDAFAFSMFSTADLPIPKIIRIGQIDGTFYCISQSMPGVSLQELRSDELPPVLAPTARILAFIAESDLKGTSRFGPFNASGVGKYESWHDFLIGISDPCKYDWSVAGGFLDIEIISRILERLHTLVAYCPEVRGLVHGDFGSTNVLTDGRRITGVIDWSEALIGDPLYDVANILFLRTWLDCMQQQARYFECHWHNFQDLSERLLCYQLRIGLGEVHENALAGRKKAAAWAVSRCRELIRQRDNSNLSKCD
jgi:hygromycin-B 4-O-kinase